MTDPHRDAPEHHAPHGQEQQAPLHDPDTVPFRGRRVPKRVIFFGTVAVIAVLVYCIANATSFAALFTRLGQVLAPVIIGGIIAYLCNPFLNFFEYFVFRKMGKGNLRRGISLLCTVLTVLAILAVAVALIVPELYESISRLVNDYHVYLNELLSFIQSVINTLPEDLAGWIDISDVEKLNIFLTDMFGSVEEAVSKLLSAVENFIVDGDIIENVWSFLSDLFTTFKNLFLGIFIAFYI
jgi:predicted PurR-regulated permease PerM